MTILSLQSTSLRFLRIQIYIYTHSSIPHLKNIRLYGLIVIPRSDIISIITWCNANALDATDNMIYVMHHPSPRCNIQIQGTSTNLHLDLNPRNIRCTKCTKCTRCTFKCDMYQMRFSAPYVPDALLWLYVPDAPSALAVPDAFFNARDTRCFVSARCTRCVLQH